MAREDPTRVPGIMRAPGTDLEERHGTVRAAGYCEDEWPGMALHILDLIPVARISETTTQPGRRLGLQTFSAEYGTEFRARRISRIFSALWLAWQPPPFLADTFRPGLRHRNRPRCCQPIKHRGVVDVLPIHPLTSQDRVLTSILQVLPFFL